MFHVQIRFFLALLKIQIIFFAIIIQLRQFNKGFYGVDK